MSTPPHSASTPRLASQLLAMINDLVSSGATAVGARITSLFHQGESWLLDRKRAQYGLAVLRILLGATVVGMLLTNWSTRLYTFGAGVSWSGQHGLPTSGFSDVWIVNAIIKASTNDGLFTALYILLGVAAIAFLLGYRSRLALLVMFPMWVGLVEINELVSDQSDNLTRIVMIALFFAAPSERWSLDAKRRARFVTSNGNAISRLWRMQPVLPAWSTNLAQNLAIIVLAAQVFFIYVAGGLYKAGGEPWSGGWALYDPIHTVQFGTWPELSTLVTAWGPTVAALTALTLLVQIGFPLMLMRRGTRIFALIVVLCFHLGIAVLMGLPWFSLAMIAIDAIFIRDVTWRSMARAIRQAWARAVPDTAHSPSLASLTV
ncbi:HTTM domain-containing protein [Microbacterium sp. NPDC089695]|uniref:HTTM domain-containing protein n=1 Tax=Microbacterium sp. NPDC089695 TaxID=3364198 RepID=UPI0038036E66